MKLVDECIAIFATCYHKVTRLHTNYIMKLVDECIAILATCYNNVTRLHTSIKILSGRHHNVYMTSHVRCETCGWMHSNALFALS